MVEIKEGEDWYEWRTKQMDELVSEGLSIEEIAYRFLISPGTVRQILKKYWEKDNDIDHSKRWNVSRSNSL